MMLSARHRTFWPKIQQAGSPFWFARMATACLNRWPLFIISQRGLTGWPLPRASAERDRYLSLITLLATTMYPAYHRQHHTRHYGFEDGFDGIKAKAREMNDTLFDYLEGQLSPNLLGGEICAADFYLYMLTRWEPNKDQMRTGRPKLAQFCDVMRQHPVIEAVLAKQPRRK